MNGSRHGGPGERSEGNPGGGSDAAHPAAIPPSRADPLPLRLLTAVVRLLPRGRGALSRLVGRSFAGYFRSCHYTSRYGARLAIAPSSLDHVVTARLWGNAWEHWVYDSCRWVLPEDGVIYDIGANLGSIAIELLHALPRSRGVLFEPQPALVDALRRSIALNQLQARARLLDLALSDSCGRARLRLFAHDGHASLSRRGRGGRSLEVSTLTLDAAVRQQQLPPPDLIKIDVEGHESQVLEGALHTLSRARPSLVFECCDRSQFRRIQALLARCGDYRCVKAHGSYRPVLPIGEENLEEGGEQRRGAVKIDILAIERSRSASLPPALAALFQPPAAPG